MMSEERLLALIEKRDVEILELRYELGRARDAQVSVVSEYREPTCNFCWAILDAEKHGHRACCAFHVLERRIDMDKRELEDRVDAARAENVGTCSGAWKRMVDYTEEQNAGQWREQAITLEAENERLRAALSKLEPFAYTAFAGGQGQDGKWHDERTCRVCGAAIEMHEDRHGAGHRYDCVYAQ